MTKRILSAALTLVVSLSLAVPALAGESRFGDVPPDHWAAEAISRANRDGAMVGTGSFPETGLARFEPDTSLTAAQFATIIAGAFYRDIPEVEGGPWYAPFQKVLEDAGLTEGADIRDWEVPMTRYQLAAVLYRFASDKELPLPDEGARAEAQGKIGDWAQVPGRYGEAVAACYAMGLLSGTDEAGSFSGEQTLTRAQTAVIYGKLADAVGIPMEQVLEERERVLKESGMPYEFHTYAGPKGTVYVAVQSGLSHGNKTSMVCVYKDGSQLDIGALLPAGYRLGGYLDPTEIELNEAGDRLSFVTPIEEGIPNEPGPGNPNMWAGYRDWGPTRCTVDLTSGTMVSMEPLTPQA